jgi:hypothetical protein
VVEFGRLLRYQLQFEIVFGPFSLKVVEDFRAWFWTEFQANWWRSKDLIKIGLNDWLMGSNWKVKSGVINAFRFAAYFVKVNQLVKSKRLDGEAGKKEDGKWALRTDEGTRNRQSRMNSRQKCKIGNQWDQGLGAHLCGVQGSRGVGKEHRNCLLLRSRLAGGRVAAYTGRTADGCLATWAAHTDRLLVRDKHSELRIIKDWVGRRYVRRLAHPNPRKQTTMDRG